MFWYIWNSRKCLISATDKLYNTFFKNLLKRNDSGQRKSSRRDPLDLSPWSFSNLNCYNSIKDSPLSVQSCLRSALWSIKGGPAGTNWVGWKAEGRWATQPCSWELTAGLSLERGGTQLWLVLASAGRSRETRWNEQHELRLSQRLGQGHNTGCTCASWAAGILD